jgi:hypothetical protein
MLSSESAILPSVKKPDMRTSEGMIISAISLENNRLFDMLTAQRMHFRLPKTGSLSDEVGIARMEIGDGPVRGGTEPNGRRSEYRENTYDQAGSGGNSLAQ